MKVTVRSVALGITAGLACYLAYIYSKTPQTETTSVEETLHTRWIVNIFYATQSGTSRKYAQSFRDRLCIAYSDVKVNLIDLELHDPNKEPIWYDPEHCGYVLSESTMVIFFLSTYGDGVAPDGCHKLVPYINKERLGKMRCMLLGLGNSTYHSDFCRFAVDAKEALIGSGASVLLSNTVDESGDQDGDFERWCLAALRCINSIKLSTKCSERNHIRIPPVVIKQKEAKPRAMLEVLDVTTLYDSRNGGAELRELRCLSISKKAEDVPETASMFVSVSITPLNCSRDVEKLLELIDLNGDERCPIVKGANMTNREFLTSEVDLQFPYGHDYFSFSIIMDIILRSLPQLDNVAGLLKVFEAYLSGNSDSYGSHIVKEIDSQYTKDETSLSDVIGHIFDTMTPTNYTRILSREVSLDILGRLPGIKPRLYSVANYSYDEVELIVTSVWRKNKRMGVCSHYISTLKRGTLLPTTFVYCQKGVIDNYSCILFIYTGSGVAPLRRLVQIIESKQLKIQLHVIGGCRFYPLDSPYTDTMSRTASSYRIASSRTVGQTSVHSNNVEVTHGCRVDAIIKKIDKAFLMELKGKGAVVACGSENSVLTIKIAVAKLCTKFGIEEIEVLTEN